jgi:predicted glycosyltransferase
MRDRSIFVGNPDDLVEDPLGPGLPSVRDWTTAHFAFAGYVTGAPPVVDREALRERLGYRPDERVCVVAVGGSGVGGPLLRRIAAAFPHAEEKVPELRMVVVCGPRIDPASVPVPPGVEVRGYVPELHRELAACDVAVVQGGLTTTMELVAAGRPFVSLPLASHFEQQFHVRHRLERYGARTTLQFADASPERLGALIAELAGSQPSYLPVSGGGASRAAGLIAELIS